MRPPGLEILGAMCARSRAEIAKTYPQLGKVAVEYAWSGTLGHPLHRMPQIGELGPGLWLASGFGGHGLNTTAMAGNLIARAIANDDPTWKLFTPFELVWAGGKYGRALAQIYYWTRRFSDALGERRAQLGEFGRRRAARQIGAVDVDRSAVGAPPPETVAEVTSSAEGGLPAGDTAPPPADDRNRAHGYACGGRRTRGHAGRRHAAADGSHRRQPGKSRR